MQPAVSLQVVRWSLGGVRIRPVCMVALWLAGMLAASAQEVTLTLTNTPSPVKVGFPIHYSLVVSNGRTEQLPPGVVFSAFPANLQPSQATNSQGGAITLVAPGLLAFDIPDFSRGSIIRVGLTLVPTQPGQLTNRFTVRTPASGSVLLESSTNAITTVMPLEADLAVTVLPPPPGVFVGDTFSWRLLATNAGPDTASGVVVINPLPPGISFLSGTPASAVSASAGQILFSVGTLTNGAAAEAIIRVLAAAAGSLSLSATVAATDAGDPDLTNNSFATNLVILEPATNVLIASIASTQTFVAQSGMMEQGILVSNTSPVTVEAFRVLVDGLTNRVFNAAGTNSGVPFVAHNAPLAAGGTVELALEYFNPSRLPGAEPLLVAHPTPALDLAPAAGTPAPISRLVRYGDERVLLEFASTNGARYQVLYATNLAPGSFIRSQPDIVAEANRTQWTDYGPPRTASKPDEAPARFYRVIQRP